MTFSIQNYIKIEPGFQKSINLVYDLFDEEKVSDFIPSSASIDVIEKLFLGVHPSSVNRAHILIGPYGRGKSHIVLVLLSLLYSKKKELFSRLLAVIKERNLDLYNFIQEYLSSNTKLLPVVVQGSSNSLNQSFLNAIQIALKDAELADLMPDTHFESAINHINKWKQDFPETYKRFEQILSEENSDSVEQFELRLKEFDSATYENFVDIYPQLSAGGVFNPFGGLDVVELYSKVVEALKAHGYSGIYLVYDEFSKYLESNIRDTSISDIKMLQDFAEKCNRSKENQLHLLLIAHKDIENYIDKLPKNKVDGWRGVSERFSHIEIQSNYNQVYEVISQAIGKTDQFESVYCKEHQELFSELTAFTEKQKIFDDVDPSKIEQTIKGCFPLHPLTTFLLPRLSELVAQNERTLFTFLSDNSTNTLTYFLKKEESQLLLPDAIYDYFEPLLKKEIYTSDIYKFYSLVNRILVNLKEDPLHSKIIKTIALVYLVNQFDLVEPTSDLIFDTFSCLYKNSEISKALEELENKKYVIYSRKSNGYLRLKTPTSKNIQLAIEQENTKVASNYTVVDILQSFVSDLFIYPTKYNDERSIIRYFLIKFISSEDTIEVDNWAVKQSSYQADGVIYAIVPSQKTDIKNVKEYLASKVENCSTSVFVLPKKFEDIKNIARHYQAISNLLDQNQDDEALQSELEIIKEDLEEVLEKFVAKYIRPELAASVYFYEGKQRKLTRKSHLPQLLSSICEIVFENTPVITNETINKNNLPSVTLNSRQKVIKGLLADKLQPMLGLLKTSQDAAIARSLLKETGLIENLEENPVVTKSSNNEKINNVINFIKDFFDHSVNKESQFSVLYEKLISPTYKIGLKRGVIPVFIALVLRSYLDNTSIYSKNLEMNIDEQLLKEINDNPENYSLKIESLTEDKKDYIDRVKFVFSKYIPVSDSYLNIASNIAKGMQRWYVSLPNVCKDLKLVKKYAEQKHNSEALAESFELFSKVISNPAINANEFLFRKLPDIFKKVDIDSTLSDDISKLKVSYENSLGDLIEEIKTNLVAIFAPKAIKGSSLTSVLKDWYDELKTNTKEHVFDSYKSFILDKIAKASGDEEFLIYQLAKAVTGLRLDDWNHNVKDDFFNQIKEFKFDIEKFDREVGLNTDSLPNSYTLSKIDAEGNTTSKTFSRVECSSTATLLKNEIMNAISEMGESISESEKRQVLLEALESLC